MRASSSLGVLAFLLFAAPTAGAEGHHGVSAGVYGGLNQAHPFVGAQAGYPFARADFFELYVDYSYGSAISEFAFQTFATGARTYFASFSRIELYHQALLGFALSSSGTAQVPERSLGERLLGAFATQGVGIDAAVWRGLHAALSVSTGYPVWLRPDLARRYRF